MYAEVNDWSVTLYVTDRNEDEIRKLRRLSLIMRDNNVTTAAVAVFNDWLSERLAESDAENEKDLEKIRAENCRRDKAQKEHEAIGPYLWFPHRDEEEVRMFLAWADIDASGISFKKFSE